MSAVDSCSAHKTMFLNFGLVQFKLGKFIWINSMYSTWYWFDTCYLLSKIYLILIPTLLTYLPRT
ncbi:hypothetical protein DFH28DRAFT_985695 [Melampsora americana]|nr:hypothetical protein DFH28DRAFT_985695 [Melampsora americana]